MAFQPHPAHRSRRPPPPAEPELVELTAGLELDPGARRALAAVVLLLLGAPEDVARIAGLVSGTGDPAPVLARLDGVAAALSGDGA